jgi:hypothetical protein
MARPCGVNGVADFDALHSGKHDDQQSWPLRVSSLWTRRSPLPLYMPTETRAGSAPEIPCNSRR